MATFSRSGPRGDIATIDAFEATLDHPLPADYREFLGTINGGIPHPNNVHEQSQGVIGIRWFLSLDASADDESLTVARETWRGRHPEGLLPIAVCDGSNLLLMDLEQSHVFYWDHDGEADENQEPRTDNLTRVAISFSGLLDSLVEFDPRKDPRYADIAGGSGTGDPDFVPEFD